MCADSLTFPIETSKDIGNNLLRNREFSEHEVNINGTRKMLRVLAVDQECQSRIIAFFGQLRDKHISDHACSLRSVMTRQV